jgi:RNA polymerase subunit RPABC4/transcription elongation factor Spt4
MKDIKTCPSCGFFMYNSGNSLLRCSNVRCMYSIHEIRCPACSGNNTEKFHDAVVCLDCGNLFLTKEEIKELLNEKVVD